MRKTVVLPSWRRLPHSDELDAPRSAYATVTEHEGYRRVLFSGGTHPEGTIAEQTRTVLEYRREALTDLGGSMADVVVTRFYVLADRLDRETQARLHEVRAELFDPPDLPASTMIGVAALLGDALVEVELEAEIPSDRWETKVLTGEE